MALNVPRPQWTNPPPSPSRSLQGLERAVPPEKYSQQRLRTTSPPDKNKPLPSQPRKSSSIYSDDSGYTEIVASYGDINSTIGNSYIDQPTPDHVVLQPVAHVEDISSLLNRRLGEPGSPPSLQSVPSIGHGSDVPGPPSLTSSTSSQIGGLDDDIAPDENIPILVERRSLTRFPSPAVYSSLLKNPFANTSSLRTTPRRRPRPADIQHEPSFRGVSYESTEKYLPGPISPRITDVVDPSLIPDPLYMARGGDGERPLSRFSRTSSESSNVVHHGIRESIRGHWHQRGNMQKKKAERKTRDRVLSAAHAKHPQMRPAIGRGTGGSPSRRRSVQQGLANISDKIRQFSFSVSSGHSDDVKDPRRGSRQRAIPLSPYQKHGPSIWDETMRRDKHKKRLREDRQRAMLGHSGNVSRENEKAGKDDRDKLVDKHKRKSAPLPLLSNFHNGQNQLVHVLGDARKRLKRNDSEKRREALKKSIRLIGQADQFSDGRVNHWI